MSFYNSPFSTFFNKFSVVQWLSHLSLYLWSNIQLKLQIYWVKQTTRLKLLSLSHFFLSNLRNFQILDIVKWKSIRHVRGSWNFRITKQKIKRCNYLVNTLTRTPKQKIKILKTFLTKLKIVNLLNRLPFSTLIRKSKF